MIIISFSSAFNFKLSRVISFGRSTLKLSTASAAAEVQKCIKGSKVMIFSKTYCPYCQKAKGIFDGLKQPYSVMVLYFFQSFVY